MESRWRENNLVGRFHDGWRNGRSRETRETVIHVISINAFQPHNNRIRIGGIIPAYEPKQHFECLQSGRCFGSAGRVNRAISREAVIAPTASCPGVLQPDHNELQAGRRRCPIGRAH